MAIPVLQHVNPGEIISSNLVNFLIDSIIDLDQRVSALSATLPSGPVSITSFEPAFQVPIGQVLTIHGVGYAFPPEQNLVKIDDVQVLVFRPSTSIRLEFIVPPIPNVPPGGRNVVVLVQNSTGSTQRLYRVTPSIPATGNPPTIINVTRTDNTNQPLTPGQDAFINGTEFATTPTDNVITMRFTVLVNGTPATINLPRSGDPPIPVTEATATRLRVTLPAMPELPLNQNIPLIVEVRKGAHPPAPGNAFVRRTT